MVVELLTVGTEILLGNIINTNAAYLAEKCAAAGLSCYYQTVVGDNWERLREAIKTALGRSDIVLVSGGLGPTEDDLTKECAASVLNRELIMHEPSRKHIEEIFKKLGMKAPDNNWKQAMIPENAVVLPNENGTAPGVILEEGEKRLILLPGPPSELEPMFEKSALPYLQALEPGVICSKTVKICGVSESGAETVIRDLIEEQSNPTIAPYAKTGEVHLRITAKADNEKEARKLVKPIVKELKNRFGNAVYTTEEDITLEKAVANLLAAGNLTVTTAESCTGGLIAARLVNVPGVSEYFKTGYITYSNKSKHKLLGVRKSSLDKKGAVSREVAEEMAKGAALAAKADAAVAVTGIAGPDGGSENKPVGLVYIACTVKGKSRVKELHLSGSRDRIRESAAAAALTLLRECVSEYYSKVTFGEK